MGRVKEAFVDWSYPRKIERFLDDLSSDIPGLYMISGYNELGDFLYYIGRSFNSVWDRVNDHYEKWAFVDDGTETVRVRFGHVFTPSKIPLEKTITDVESALIFNENPLVNRMQCRSYKWWHQYVVYNLGYAGLVSPVIDMRDH